ncbi:MAG: hypothetical protein J6C41_05555 [Oscillospiraceae bacterium]|nr:hypothetical protein [Oscillospiraceae bacterium]
MKQVKRVFAFLLSLCLIFSIVPAVKASAASTEFTITGIQAYNFRGSDWYIILNTDNADFSLSTAASVATSGATLDGAAAGGWFQPGTGTLAFTLATDKASHKVVFPAGMVLNGFTLKEDYVFFTQADGSVKAGVSVNSINAYNYREASSDWYIVLGTDRADFSLSAASSLTNAGVTVDDAVTSGWFQPGTGTLAFTLATDKANHKVVIPQGAVLGNYVLAEDYAFCTYADGAVGPAAFEITGINAYNFRGSDWYIILQTNNSKFNLTAAASVATSGATLDGAAAGGWFQPGTGTLAFTLATDKAEHKVVLPAGMQLGNYVLAKDYVFYTHDNGRADNIAPFSITGIKGYNFRGSDWYIILETSDPDFALTSVASVANAGVTVDGAAAAGGWFQATTGTLEFTLATDKAEHKVVIPAGTTLGNYKLTSDYVFYTHASGAVDTNAPVINITGIKAYNYREANADWYIVLNVDDAAFSLPSALRLNATVDGVAASGWIQPKTGTLEFSVTADKADHEIIIPAGTVLGSYTLENEYVFYTHANGQVDNIKPIRYVNVTGINAYNYREANADWYIVLNVDDAAFSLPSALRLNATVDGVAASGWIQPTTGTLEFSVTADKADHEIIIPAGTVLGDYVLENDYVFYTHANGAVNTEKPVKYVNITGINAYNYREANADWYIVLAVDDAAFSLPTALRLNATVDGVAASGWIQPKTGTLEFSVTADKADHEIIIPAGTVLGDYVLENEYVLYTHANGQVDNTKPIQYVNVTGINAYNYREANADWYIVLAVDDAAFSLPTALRLNATVDGVAASGWIQPTTGTLEFTLSTDKAEHYVVIPAGTVLGDYVLQNDYAFYTHSNGYADTNAPVINITGITAYNFRDASADWYIVLETDNESFSLSDVASLTTAGVTVDGAAASGWFQPATGTLEFSLKTDKAEHKVIIPAGTVLGKYTLENEFVFYTHANSSVSTTPYIHITDVSGGYNNQYIVYLTTDLPYTLTINQQLTVNVDGSDVSVWLNVAEVPFISTGSAMAMDEHIIVIPAGTMLGDSMLGEEFTFYTHADGTVDLEDPTVDEPAYPTVSLTVKDENGQSVMNRSVAWHTDSIALVEQELKASVAEGKLLLGYTFNDALYASIGNIAITDGSALDITLKTLDLAVHTEIRHGADMADSGLRFVAALGQTEYIPKVLLISETAEDLTVSTAQWKIGNPYHTDEKPFIEITAVDGTVCYSIVLTNIPAADYNKTYYACAGVLVEYADIGQNYVYTDAIASTVNEAAQSNWLNTDVQNAYVNGVMVLDADANLIGNRDYTISVSNNANGDYVIAYTGGNVQVSALTIEGLRFTAEDGVVFGDGVVTVPGGLFAAAKLEQELVDVQDKMDIGAYYGPSAGTYRYTESNGTVSDMSVKRTHDAVYADVEDYFGAGFNIWMAEDWVYGGTRYSENDAFSALDLAAEYCINHGLTNEDIQVLITDGFINGLLDGTDMNNGDRNAVSQYASIAESHVNALISYNPVVNGVQVGTQYNCFAGFLLRDEPYYSHMSYYAPWFSFLAADADQTVTVTAWNTSGEQISGEVSCLGLLDQGYTLYFSLLGMGASKQTVVPGSTSADPCTEEEYLAYVNQFVNNVNATVWNHENMVLAFDNYGLYTEASTSFASSTIRYTEKMSATWQQNYALFADIIESKGGNATFAAALRSDGMVRKSLGGFWSSNTWKEFQAFDASWGAEAISMQAYTALAHGYSYINYYTYWEPSNQAHKGETYTDACVMWDDNMNPVKQNMYYWVQSANAEVRQLENLIANFSYVDTAAIAAGSSFYTGTGNVGGTDMGGLWTAAQLAENSALAAIFASVDTTAGYFSKADGRFNDMFILVNMSHPNQAASDTVSMTFDAGYSCVIVYLDGVASVYQLQNGQCSVTLPSGEGAVVIPVA